MPVPSDTTRYTVRPSKLSDVYLIAPNLRAEDVAEIKAASGSTPVIALTQGLENSETCYTADWGNEPFLMFGVVPIDDITGAVWLLGTPKIAEVSRAFLRESRRIVDELHDVSPLLFNYVDERNEVHIKWIKWLGFEFINRHEEYGHEGRPFLEFVRIRKTCANQSH